jgi:hypothetical protein
MTYPIVTLVVLMTLTPLVAWKPIPSDEHEDYRFQLVCSPISAIVALAAYLFYAHRMTDAVACLIALAVTSIFALVRLRQKIGDPRKVALRFSVQAIVTGIIWSVIIIGTQMISPH